MKLKDLLPYRKYTYHSPLSVDEVLLKLDMVIDKKRWFFSDITGKYRGIITHNTFELYDYFTPYSLGIFDNVIAKGKITEAQSGGSFIIVKVELSVPMMGIYLLTVFMGAFLLFINLYALFSGRIDADMVLFAGIPFVWYLFQLYLYLNCAWGINKRLAHIFKTKSPEGSAPDHEDYVNR